MKNNKCYEEEGNVNHLYAGQRVQMKGTDKVGTVMRDMITNSGVAWVRWDGNTSSDSIYVENLKYAEKGFKYGDIVKCIGVSGHGTVTHEQDGPNVHVEWDGGRWSTPLASNLRLINTEPKVELKVQGAIDIIREQRQQLLQERAALNERIDNLNSAISLLQKG